jgi:hypothetical protein
LAAKEKFFAASKSRRLATMVRRPQGLWQSRARTVAKPGKAG